MYTGSGTTDTSNPAVRPLLPPLCTWRLQHNMAAQWLHRPLEISGVPLHPAGTAPPTYRSSVPFIANPLQHGAAHGSWRHKRSLTQRSVQGRTDIGHRNHFGALIFPPIEPGPLGFCMKKHSAVPSHFLKGPFTIASGLQQTHPAPIPVKPPILPLNEALAGNP